MKAPEDWQTIADVVRNARVTLPPMMWSFSGSGPETEVTIRRNRSAFDRLALMPQLLRGVANPDSSTTFLGHTLSLPVMLAPVGTITMWHAGGAPSPARVANRMGTLNMVPSSAPLEDTRAAVDGPLIFQLYAYQGDRDWQKEMLQRTEKAGYSALCLTVDSAGGGIRDRPLANRSLWWTEPGNLSDDGLGGRISRAPRSADGSRGVRAASQASTGVYANQGRLSWEDLKWLRDSTTLPIILKGVMSARDAELALESGMNAIYVSNHGGRRQDALPSAMEVLPAVAKAVDGRVPIVIDSGFIRGTDAVKALALGATVVAVGKLMIWALAAGGEVGLLRMLELMQREIRTTMAVVGASTVDELSPDMVVPSFEPAPAPWPIEPMDLLPL